MNNSTIITVDFYNSSFYIKIGTTEYLWSDSDSFVTDTSFPFREAVRSLSYEPDRNLFIVELINNEVHSGTENNVIQWVTDNLVALETCINSKQVPDPVITVEMIRAQKLIETDWIIQRHQEETLLGITNTLSASQFMDVLLYRQALRDITDTYARDLPEDQAVWPVNPLESQ